MNEQDSTEFGGTAVRLDQGHIEGSGGIPERFRNPGLPAHTPRMADLDEAAAARAEKQVVALFSLSILGTILFLAAYFLIDLDRTIFIPGIGTMSASNAALGVTMALTLLGIGFGAVHWAKTLMPDTESVEMRHPMRSTDESRAAVGETLAAGAVASQITRRPQVHPRRRARPHGRAADRAGRWWPGAVEVPGR